jgi:hypothetical protein
VNRSAAGLLGEHVPGMCVTGIPASRAARRSLPRL